MGLETAEFIGGLVEANPITASDSVTEGSDHLRLLKKTIKQTFGDMQGLWELPTNAVWIKQSNIAADGFINMIKVNASDEIEIGAAMIAPFGLTASLTGDVIGDVTGNVSGSALTVTQASQSAITSVGVLTSLVVSGALACDALTANAITLSKSLVNIGVNADVDFLPFINAEATLQIGSRTTMQSVQNDTHISNNAAWSSNTDWRFIQNAAASTYASRDGLHNWRVASSGTAGNVIGWNEGMTLTAASNLDVAGDVTAFA